MPEFLESLGRVKKIEWGNHSATPNALYTGRTRQVSDNPLTWDVTWPIEFPSKIYTYFWTRIPSRDSWFGPQDGRSSTHSRKGAKELGRDDITGKRWLNNGATAHIFAYIQAARRWLVIASRQARANFGF